MTNEHNQELTDALGANTMAQIHATQSTEGSASDLQQSLTTAMHATDESTATSSFLSSNIAGLTGRLQENLSASESLREAVWHMSQVSQQVANALLNNRTSTETLAGCFPASTLSNNQLTASTDNLSPKIESLQEQIARLNLSIGSLTNVIEQSMRAQNNTDAQLMELCKLLADQWGPQPVDSTNGDRW
ncbi:hypothetical protein FZI91_10590 [Mycobacterium sp. CBMA271]|uniref:hypothetical protein n=1 Tax=unclassified Mycobacteroides TaxID=2618759 RepID=UPI001326ED44|nr:MULTISPECIES: hypothetical protein [unclassified Mycobacteroides]MUM16338.1 hypothetical protein [Mycobacteroides sp. CBMA 326]MUM22150.1 hypothetical protein [Mycobacteroides sp. CBMA 271]